MAPEFAPWRSALAGAVLAAITLVLLALGSGAPSARAEDAPSPSPPLLLPWADGETWLTGISGFHGANDALDFFPPDTPLSMDLICEGEPGWYEAESSYWVLAAAAGMVTYADGPFIMIDHGNGWSTGYYHMSSFQVRVGDFVQAGQRLAHPSTYGACTTGPHVHFWALGPDGATTADAALSGTGTADIGINAYIWATGNVPPGSAPAAGDADCDGDVDTADALATMRESAVLPHGAACVAAADVDCNGAIETVDALAILRFAAGLEASLNACSGP